jgi:DNA-binding NtrC family response regulator
VLSGGNDVEVAGSIAEAQNQNRPFDVVLLDKGLPDGSGISLIPLLRQRNPRVAMIVLTGDADYTPVREALAAGADDYLVKTEQLLADLWVRIPIATQNAERRFLIEERGQLPNCRLPEGLSDVTPEHFDRYREIAERDYLMRALELSRNHHDEAAARMGIGRSTLFAKLRLKNARHGSAEA